MSYPAYTRAERIADAMVHVLGVAAAIIGVSALFWILSAQMDWKLFTAVSVYSAALLAMLTASAAYHILADTAARPLLRRLDHAAIYLKIAGTVTPLSFFLGTPYAYVLLALVWGLALGGARSKLRAARGRMTTGWAPYLGLGCMGVALIYPLSQMLPQLSLGLMLGGGALYVAGIVFYACEKLRFSNAIWHVFVLAASACFFFGISTAVKAAGPF